VKYQSGRAFRQALEGRLKSLSRQSGLPLVRLRKMVAFERFLARLTIDQPGSWLLKGGLALQWRLGNLTRTTKDLDVLLTVPVQDVHQALVRAALRDIGDWFRFLVQQPPGAVSADAGVGLRLHVRSLLDGRPFEAFHIDVGLGDPVIEAPEELIAPPLLDFAGVGPTAVLCYPATQHIAEKVHAYTRPHPSGDSSRVKDLVDILLIAQSSAVDGLVLSKAVRATFEARGTHALPPSLPDAPTGWVAPFTRMVRDVGLRDIPLADAVEMARTFLDPTLRGEVEGRWDPETWSWRRMTRRG
jgi:hypothetical protein